MSTPTANPNPHLSSRSKGIVDAFRLLQRAFKPTTPLPKSAPFSVRLRPYRTRIYAWAATMLVGAYYFNSEEYRKTQVGHVKRQMLVLDQFRDRLDAGERLDKGEVEMALMRVGLEGLGRMESRVVEMSGEQEAKRESEREAFMARSKQTASEPISQQVWDTWSKTYSTALATLSADSASVPEAPNHGTWEERAARASAAAQSPSAPRKPVELVVDPEERKKWAKNSFI